MKKVMSGIPIAAFCSPLFASLLLACNGVPRPELPAAPVFQRVTWEGMPPLRHVSDSAHTLEEIDRSAGVLKVHTLDFLGEDTLRLILREYPKDYQAYRAFQEKAMAEEIRDGFYREKNSIFFIHGPFLGEFRYLRGGMVPATFLRDRLSFAGEDLFQRPIVFRSFPLAGQIPFSERVVSSEFLGRKGTETVFTVSSACHGDTATLFRSFGTPSAVTEAWIEAWKGQTTRNRWSGNRRFSGVQEQNRPLLFWIFKGEFLGVMGCYDPKLSQEYVEKMEKMMVLVPNP